MSKVSRTRESMKKLFRGAILGAPASGKGTIAKKIIDKFDVTHVSTGDILRQIIATDLPTAKTIKNFISEGKLVPDDVVLQIVLDKLTTLADRNWMCDGFPRNLHQAEQLYLKHPLDLVMHLKVPFEEIVERVKGRLVHVPSGRVYNTSYKPPKKAGIDDVTGEPLVQRPDDKPEAVMKRLNLYARLTEPMLNYYREKGVLQEFSGLSSDEIWKSVEQVLKKHMKPKS